MNVIANSTLVPHGGGFVYVDPDSGLRLIHCTVGHLGIMARKHRQANNYPIGAHWGQDFIDNVCANTPGDICVDEELPTVVQRAKSMARALFESARGGFKTLSAEEVQARLTACETTGPGGGACESFRGVKGLFHVACGACGCTKLKMHLKSSVCPKNRWPEL